MICINIDNRYDNKICGNIEYDLRAILKAFYPARDIVYECENPFLNVNVICDEKEVTVIFKQGTEELINETLKLDENVKDRFDILIYTGLARVNGRTLPWGILTGIRPTKIVYALIEEGKTVEEAVRYLEERYLVSHEKATLAVDIAVREKAILDTIDYKDGYSLYIGIPFCPTTCLYCSFTSYPLAIWKSKVDNYLDALIKEMKYVAERFKDKHLDSVYIGGGTPTTLEPYQLERLISAVEDNFDLSGIREFTVEAGRPDSVTRDKLEVLRKHNIDRISVNPQTMNQKTLDLIGRRHSVEDVKNAFNLARECGFTNINMDLIVGLPGEDIEDVRYTLNEIEHLEPDSLTVHSLALKRAAALNIKKDDYKEYKVTNTDEIISLTRQYAQKLGLQPYYMYRQKNMAGNYENVGYSKEGKEGIYNILIMEEKQTIVAIGAGASSKLVFPDGNRIERVENVKDVKNYIERIDEMIERKAIGFDMILG